MINLRTATAGDRTALMALLAEAGMDYTDPPEAYTLALAEGKIAGCGRIEDHGHFVMLRPLVVAGQFQGHGVGRHILQSIIPPDKPTALVARGESVKFYKTMGFFPTVWENVSAEQQAECESCPNRPECLPQPMIYIPAACNGNAP